MRPSPVSCPGPMSRRSFMRIGGLSLGALAGGASLHLNDLLAAEERTPNADNDFSVILLWAAGGPSQPGTRLADWLNMSEGSDIAAYIGLRGLFSPRILRLGATLRFR